MPFCSVRKRMRPHLAKGLVGIRFGTAGQQSNNAHRHATSDEPAEPSLQHTPPTCPNHPKGITRPWRSSTHPMLADVNRIEAHATLARRPVDNRPFSDLSPLSGGAPERNRCGWRGPLAYNVHVPRGSFAERFDGASQYSSKVQQCPAAQRCTAGFAQSARLSDASRGQRRHLQARVVSRPLTPRIDVLRHTGCLDPQGRVFPAYESMGW
jgi:hypothetical protein